MSASPSSLDPVNMPDDPRPRRHFHVGAMTFPTADAARHFARVQRDAGYLTARATACNGVICMVGQGSMLDASGRLQDDA